MLVYVIYSQEDENSDMKDYYELHRLVKNKVESLYSLENNDIHHLLNETLYEIIQLILLFVLENIPVCFYGRKLQNLYSSLLNDNQVKELISTDDRIREKLLWLTKVVEPKYEEFLNSYEKTYFSNYKDRAQKLSSILSNLDERRKEVLIILQSNYEKITSTKKQLLEKEIKLDRNPVNKYVISKKPILEKVSFTSPYQSLSLVGKTDCKVTTVSKTLSNIYTYVPSLLGKELTYSASLLLLNSYIVATLYKMDRNKIVFKSFDELMKYVVKK